MRRPFSGFATYEAAESTTFWLVDMDCLFKEAVGYAMARGGRVTSKRRKHFIFDVDVDLGLGIGLR